MKGYKYLIPIHLSVILGCFLPFGNIWGPWVMGKLYPERKEFLRPHIANIVNFQIVWSIVFCLFMVVYWYYAITRMSQSENYRSELLAVFVVLAIAVNLIYPLINTLILVTTRQIRLFYPRTIRFLK